MTCYLLDLKLRKADLRPLGVHFWSQMIFFQRVTCHTIVIFRVHVAASPHGGPVALLSRPPSPAKPHIEIYNGAGRQIGAFKWNSGMSSIATLIFANITMTPGP